MNVITVICDVMACSLVYIYRIIEGKCYSFVRNKKKVYLLLTLHLCVDRCLFLPFYFNCHTAVIFIGYKNYYHDTFSPTSCPLTIT